LNEQNFEVGVGFYSDIINIDEFSSYFSIGGYVYEENFYNIRGLKVQKCKEDSKLYG
jgi:hypothetical protein